MIHYDNASAALSRCLRSLTVLENQIKIKSFNSGRCSMEKWTLVWLNMMKGGIISLFFLYCHKDWGVFLTNKIVFFFFLTNPTSSTKSFSFLCIFRSSFSTQGQRRKNSRTSGINLWASPQKNAAPQTPDRTLCRPDAGKWQHLISSSFLFFLLLCISSPAAPPPRGWLRGDVDPEPAQQRPVHPGSGVQFPAVLGQEHWQRQSRQDNHRREGFGQVQRRRLALPGELAYFVCVLRLVEVRQQPLRKKKKKRKDR